MRRKDEPCICCGKDVRECDCKFDSTICYGCGCCPRHCVCVGGRRTGLLRVEERASKGAN